MDGPRPADRTPSGPRPGPARTVLTTLTTAGVRRLAPLFAGVLTALAAGHVLFLLVPSLHVLTIFDLGEERSFGTWVGSTLHLLCAVLAVLGALLARRDASRWAANWWLLAVVFLAMSADETASAHDRLVDPLQERFSTSGVLLYPWVVVGLVLGAVFMLVQLRFLRSLGRTGLRLFLAGAVFAAGAVGLEMLEGVVASPGGPGRSSLLYRLLVMVEELMEVGALMWVVLILGTHLVVRAGSPRLLLEPTTGTADAAGARPTAQSPR